RDIVQLETVVSTISQEYLLEFTSEYGISEDLHSELPGTEEMIVDFLEGKRVFPIVADWRTSAPKDEMPAEDTYSPKAVTVLNTRCTPIQKQPEALLCLVGLSWRYFLGDDVYPAFLHDDDRDMDLFNLIRALNPTKVKTGTRPRAAHEVPLLTVTASRVIEMEDLAMAKDSFRVPSTIQRSPLKFANKNPSQQSTGEADLAEEIATIGPCVIKERRKRGNDGVDTNAPPKVLRKDHADSRPIQIPLEGKPLLQWDYEWDPLSLYLLRGIRLSSKGAAVVRDPKSKNTTFTSMVGSPESIYQPEWGVTNGCRLDAPEVCQDLVDHIAPPGYFSELRHLHNEAKLLKKSVAQVARRDQRNQARENEIKNLEALLEAKTDMKKTAEAKNAELDKELENLRALFSDL
nr:hypothetical protein [Tanacetum cinerariifolium]